MAQVIFPILLELVIIAIAKRSPNNNPLIKAQSQTIITHFHPKFNKFIIIISNLVGNNSFRPYVQDQLDRYTNFIKIIIYFHWEFIKLHCT